MPHIKITSPSKSTTKALYCIQGASPVHPARARYISSARVRVALTVIFPSHVFNAHVCTTGVQPHGKFKGRRLSCNSPFHAKRKNVRKDKISSTRNFRSTLRRHFGLLMYSVNGDFDRIYSAVIARTNRTLY